MFEFNWFDYIILGVIVISGLISLARGLLKEALSLIGWLLAFWVAIKFHPMLSNHLAQWVNSTELRSGISFTALFMATLFICGIANFIIVGALQKTGLSGTDRLLGMLFGLARGVLLVTLVLLLLRLTYVPNEPWWKQSQLIPHFSPVESWITELIPQMKVQETIENIPQEENVEFAEEYQEVVNINNN